MMEQLDHETREAVKGVIIIAAYLLPTIVALLRRHRNGTAIMAANVLFGWMGIPWFGVLVWSLTSHRKPRRKRRQPMGVQP